jgi:hypothetical protein
MAKRVVRMRRTPANDTIFHNTPREGNLANLPVHKNSAMIAPKGGRTVGQ